MPRRARPPIQALFVWFAVSACSAAPPMPDPLPPHPASPETVEAARPAASTTLEMPQRRATPPNQAGRGH